MAKATPRAPKQPQVAASVPLLPAAVEDSISVWSRDLRGLFEHAKERFGDVCWHGEEDTAEYSSRSGRSGEDAVWGHKAIVYARAPKAFKDRYFQSSFGRPPTTSPYVVGNNDRPKSRGLSRRGSHETASSQFFVEDSAVSLAGRQSPSGPVLQLDHGGTPEMFASYLEWLYTSEGLGDVVEWINEDEDDSNVHIRATENASPGFGLGLLSVNFNGGTRDSKGRQGTLAERRERLGQDLTYMWRSKLYADVKILLHLGGPNQHPPSASRLHQLSLPLRRQTSASSVNLALDPSIGPIEDEYEHGTLEGDQQGETAIFSAHRFILCSRSPYFAQVLLNSGSFQPHSASMWLVSDAGATVPHTPEIILPSPPFTPAALHFVLGYLYAGNLAFSNRTFDLSTAFAIHRAATFLEINALEAEIEARIVWDFCHGLLWDRPLASGAEGVDETVGHIVPRMCRCKRCLKRIPRVWRFANAPDVKAQTLSRRANQYMTAAWGTCWGREVATADPADVKDLLDAVLKLHIDQTHKIVDNWRHLVTGRRRLAQDMAVSSGGPQPASSTSQTWDERLSFIYDEIEAALLLKTLDNLKAVLDSDELHEVIEGKNFEEDLIEKILKALEDSTGALSTCRHAGMVYQHLVSSLLLRTNPDNDELAMALGSSRRELIESTKECILAHIKRRWHPIQSDAGFHGMEIWALKEISDEIDVSMEDLLKPVTSAASRDSGVNARIKALAAKGTAKGTAKATANRPTSIRSTDTSRTASTIGRPASIRTLRTTATVRGQARPAFQIPVPPTPASAPRSVPGPSAKLARPAVLPVSTSQRTVLTESTGSRPAPQSPAAASALARKRVASNLSAANTAAAVPRIQSQSSLRPSQLALPTTTLPRERAVSTDGRRFAPRPAHGFPPASSSSKALETRQRTMSAGLKVSSHSKIAGAPAPPATSSGTATAGALDRPASVRSVASTRTNTAAITQARVPPVPSVRTVAAARTSLSNTVTSAALPSAAKYSTSGKVTTGEKVTVVSGKSPARSPNVSISSIRSGLSIARVGATLSASSDKRSTTLPRSTTSTLVAPIARKAPTLLRQSASTANVASPNSSPSPVMGQPAIPRKNTSSPRTIKQDPRASADNPGSEQATPKAPSMAASVQSVRKTSSGSSEQSVTFPALGPSTDTTERVRGLRPLVLASSTAQSSVVPSTPPSTSTSFSKSASSQQSIRPTHWSLSSTGSRRIHPASAFDPTPIPKPNKKIRMPRVEVSDGTTPVSSTDGVSLVVGIPCVVSLSNRRARFKALCKYLGRINNPDRPGSWVGLEVSEQVAAKFDLFEDSSDGSINGVRYFSLGDNSTPDPPQSEARVVRRQRIAEIEQRLGGEIHSPQPRVGSRLPGLGDLGTSRHSDGRVSRSSCVVTPIPTPFEVDLTSSWISSREDEGASPRGRKTFGLFVRPEEVVFVVGGGD